MSYLNPTPDEIAAEVASESALRDKINDEYLAQEATPTKSRFITGDRMMAQVYPAMVMLEMLNAAAHGVAIMTGINDGVEALVRAVAEKAGISIEVVEQFPLKDEANPGHWIDWDARHLGLPETCEVVSIHVDTHTCRVTMSALNVLPDERVRLVTLADLA